MVIGVHPLGAKTFAHRAMEHPKQGAAVDRELRPAVPGADAARFAPDPLAVLGVVDEFRGRDAHRVQRVEQAELRELAGRVREQVDPDPDLLHARRRLVDVDVTKTRVVQCQGERHAADAAACDRHSRRVRMRRTTRSLSNHISLHSSTAARHFGHDGLLPVGTREAQSLISDRRARLHGHFCPRGLGYI
jgi:hypothetical protein